MRNGGIGYADERGQWVNTDNVDPAVYARNAADWLRRGARLIGGCCGTTPAHVAALDQVRREFAVKATVVLRNRT